ncbi:MAG: efflux RND transporter periplasmic adaptor subunit [Acidobacteriia bacterium]|nr:efflux RND transporter periplasmic adaptor subunit [Terriglobia bacterium]
MKKQHAAAIILLVVAGFIVGRYSGAKRDNPRTTARRILYYVDPMHPSYHSDKPGIAPDCGMQLEPVYAEDAYNAPRAAALAQSSPGDVSIDGGTQGLLGIRVATVEKSGAPHLIRVVGHVVPEDTRVYRVNSGTEGFVRETYNDSVGVQVKKDQKLATSYTGETLAVASGFLAATAGVPGANGKDGSRTVPFPGTLAKQGSSSIQGYTDRLRNLGVSEVQIKQMAENRQLPESVDIVAPADGFILARNISPGQHFEHSTEFYRIADLSRVWILADIFGSEAQSFHPGALARVTLSGQGKTFSARVSNVLPQVDPATRTLKLRLEADNPGFALRPDMYVDVELPVAMPAGLTVPQDAVIDSGREQRVFVERSSGVFEPRPVQTGWRSGDRVQIVHGLSEGERVVSAGTFLVDSESRLKSAGQKPLEPQRHEKGVPRSNNEPGLTASAGKVKDTACGMMIDAAKAVAEGNTVTRDGVTYYFCSDSCKKKFGAQPEHYLALNPSERRHD